MTHAMKKCRVCQSTKSVDDFYLGRARCKNCYNAAAKELRQTPAQKVRIKAQQQHWYWSGGGREQQRVKRAAPEYKQKDRDRHREAYHEKGLRAVQQEYKKRPEVAERLRQANRKRYYEKNLSVTRWEHDQIPENRERRNARRKERRRTDPVFALADKLQEQNRRASGRIDAAFIAWLRGKQKNKCAICRRSLKHGEHIDHIMPLSLGGKTEERNIQLLCPSCNLHKAAKHPVDHMQRMGFLL